MSKARVSPTNNQSSSWQNIINKAPIKGVHARDWTYRLCGCCEDCKECGCAFFCTPCYMCRIINRIDDKCCSCIFGGPIPLRTKIRTTRKIKGSITGDCCTCAFCPCCTLVQMGREAKDTESLL